MWKENKTHIKVHYYIRIRGWCRHINGCDGLQQLIYNIAFFNTNVMLLSIDFPKVFDVIHVKNRPNKNLSAFTQIWNTSCSGLRSLTNHAAARIVTFLFMCPPPSSWIPCCRLGELGMKNNNSSRNDYKERDHLCIF